MEDYPDRPELIGLMQPIFKAARREVPPEMAGIGVDRVGLLALVRLRERLVRHLYFEHLGRKAIWGGLGDAVRRYRATASDKRPPWREAAGHALDPMAQEPLRRTVYLGVEHLSLPHGTQVGEVRFVDPSTDSELEEAFARLGGDAPTLVCEIETAAGTVELLRDRARDTAEIALALVRQQCVFGMASVKIFRFQVLFGLTGAWTMRDGGATWQAGWWRQKDVPVPMELTHANMTDWRSKLAELADLHLALEPEVRERVDTCLGWLDVAALSDRWRIIIPAVFSAMEALLVPEDSGLKAGVVTVRSVAVHAALDHGFFDPGEIVSAYELRSDLVHGAPTLEILSEDVTDFAHFRRVWAFQVLTDYLDLVKRIGARTVKEVVTYLDEGKCNEVCEWLEAFGGEDVVAEYRKLVPAPEAPAAE